MLVPIYRTYDITPQCCHYILNCHTTMLTLSTKLHSHIKMQTRSAKSPGVTSQSWHHLLDFMALHHNAASSTKLPDTTPQITAVLNLAK